MRISKVVVAWVDPQSVAWAIDVPAIVESVHIIPASLYNCRRGHVNQVTPGSEDQLVNAR
jgi:hypothetical protein